MVYMTKLVGQVNNGDGEEEVLAMESIQLFDAKFHLKVCENDDFKVEE
jgi:hypothetical protein